MNVKMELISDIGESESDHALSELQIEILDEKPIEQVGTLVLGEVNELSLATFNSHMKSI